MTATYPVISDGAEKATSKAEARSAGLTRYFTGKPCKHGHISEREVASGNCTECLRLKQAALRKASPERSKEVQRRYREKNKKRLLELKRAWQAANPEKVEAARRKFRLKRFGGIEVFDALFQKQDGKCAICSTGKGALTGQRRLAVDHCHTTNVVRGLLCGSCNRMLGFAKDSPKTLLEAVAYLAKHELSRVSAPGAVEGEPT